MCMHHTVLQSCGLSGSDDCGPITGLVGGCIQTPSDEEFQRKNPNLPLSLSPFGSLFTSPSPGSSARKCGWHRGIGGGDGGMQRLKQIFCLFAGAPLCRCVCLLLAVVGTSRRWARRRSSPPPPPSLMLSEGLRSAFSASGSKAWALWRARSVEMLLFGSTGLLGSAPVCVAGRVSVGL